MSAFIKSFLVGVFLSTPAYAATPKPLVMGVFPYLSTHTLLSTYQPLRIYLAQNLARQVAIVTAPSMREFYARSHGGLYDIIVTPPHFARLHQSHSKLLPLLAYSNPTIGLLVTRRDSGIKNIEGLRGHEIAVADPSALVGIMARSWLGSYGLESARDYVFRTSGSHNSAVMSVINHDAAAAVVGGSALKQIASQFKEQVVVLAQVGEVMGLVMLANPGLGTGLPEIEKALAEFPRTSQGKQFFEINAIGGFKPIDPAELRKLDVFLPETLRWLKEGGQLHPRHGTN